MTTFYASPTGNDANDGLTAGTPKTAAGAWAAAAELDTIRFLDGDYGTVTFAGKNNIFLRAHNEPAHQTIPGFASNHPSRRDRTVRFKRIILDNADGIVLTWLHMKWTEWVDITLGEVWGDNGTTAGQDTLGLLYFLTSCDDVILEECETSWGYGPTQTPFDPTVGEPGRPARYPEMESNVFNTSQHNGAGWGDSVKPYWETQGGLDTVPDRANNIIKTGPAAIRGASGALMNGLQVLRCHLHDLTRGIVFTMNDKIAVVDQCWIERCYNDTFTFGNPSSVQPGLGLQLTRNIMEGAFGHGKDAYNPHTDGLQQFGGGGFLFPNLWIERNFWFNRHNDRAGFQAVFMQGGAYVANPIIRDNTFVQHDIGNCLFISGAQDGVVENNILISVPNRTSSTAPNLRLETGAAPNPGVPLIRNNISTAINLQSHQKAENNLNVGKNFASVAYGEVFTGTFPSPDDSASGWFSQFARQPAHATKGPRFAALSNLVLDALDLSNLPVFLGDLSKTFQPVSTLTVSGRAALRGPAGSTLDLSVDSGEYQVEDVLGNIVHAWRSTALNGFDHQNKHYIWRRRNASGLHDTSVTQALTVNHATATDHVATFSVTTASNIQPPIIKVPTGINVDRAAPMGVASRKAIFVTRFRMVAAPTGSNYSLIGSSSIRGVRVRLLSTGIIRLVATDSASAGLTSGNDGVGALQSDREYLFGFVLDLDNADPAKRAMAHAWDLSGAGSNQTFPSLAAAASSANIDHGHGTGTISASETTNDTNFAFVYFDDDNVTDRFGRLIDPRDPSFLELFSVPFLGANGEGPTGVQPDHFLIGDEVEWNAGMNRGNIGGALWVPTSTGVTLVSDAPWPPQLSIFASIEPVVGDRLVGDPVTVTLTRNGYGPAANVTITPSLAGTWDFSPTVLAAGDAVAVGIFTPSVAGELTFSFANDGGYTNPTPPSALTIIATVVPAPGVPRGSRMRLRLFA